MNNQPTAREWLTNAPWLLQRVIAATWEEAYGFIADKLSAIKKSSGPESIAGLSSARCSNEENYLFQKWMRACVGTNHIDNGARLASGSSFLGMMASTGSPGTRRIATKVRNISARNVGIVRATRRRK